eukprot:4244369-Heterocapsa_arctica.AAC.1
MREAPSHRRSRIDTPEPPRRSQRDELPEPSAPPAEDSDSEAVDAFLSCLREYFDGRPSEYVEPEIRAFVQSKECDELTPQEIAENAVEVREAK